MLEKYIQTKVYKPKDGKTWVTGTIKHLMNKGDRLSAKL